MKNTKYQLLFVEDDPEMSAIYKENFTDTEFEATLAKNGCEALDMLRANQNDFDLVITDNYMPQMNGVTLMKRIHEQFPELKVILVTAYGDWDDYVEAEKSGVLRFIDKPVKMSQLKKLIENLIRNGDERNHHV